MPENTGALVAGVTPDSPAAKAGVEAGDVILKFDGKDVTTMRGLPRLVAQTPIDKTVGVEVLRKGQTQDAAGRRSAGSTDDEESASSTATTPAERPDANVLGLKLSPLTDELRSKYGLDAGMKGAVVDGVDPKSPAAQKRQARRRHRRGRAGAGARPEDVARRHREGQEDGPQVGAAAGRGRQGRSRASSRSRVE